MWRGFAPLLMKPQQPGNSDSYPDGTTDPNINSSVKPEKISSINGNHDGADGAIMNAANLPMAVER